jgi:hypothetical protein
MKIESSQQIFKNIVSNLKFHQNLSSGSHLVPCGPIDRDGWIDKMKLIVAFHNFANAPEMFIYIYYIEQTSKDYMK